VLTDIAAAIARATPTNLLAGARAVTLDPANYQSFPHRLRRVLHTFVTAVTDAVGIP
jgi:hypothetical protein